MSEPAAESPTEDAPQQSATEDAAQKPVADDAPPTPPPIPPCNGVNITEQAQASNNLLLEGARLGVQAAVW